MTNTQIEANTVTNRLADKQLLPLLDHLARVARRSGEARLEPGGLRPRHLIALRLLSEGGPTSQQACADSLSLDPSNVVGLLNELEERQLITRRRDPAAATSSSCHPAVRTSSAWPTADSAFSRTIYSAP